MELITYDHAIYFLCGAVGGFIGVMYDTYSNHVPGSPVMWRYITAGVIIKALMGGVMAVVVNHHIQYAILCGVGVDKAHQYGQMLLKRFFKEDN